MKTTAYVGRGLVVIALILSLLTPLGGSTPAAANQIHLANDLRISQVYGGGGGAGYYLYDYAELFNAGAASVDLTGWSLQYGSATGQFASSATNLYAFPNGTTVAAGQYLLVQLGSAGTEGIALPVTPDLVTTNAGMSQSNGKLALANIAVALGCGATATPCALPDARIVDLAAWGTANNAEGGVTINNGVALNNQQGGVRKESGCQDTDHNGNDFDVLSGAALLPRNSASPTHSCTVSQPSIALSKTVGTDPTSCATTAEIALPAGGGEVTYCYEVTNTGDVTLNQHDLDDSELGNLFTGLSYALAPGASAFITETATIAMTTVNTALWTAYNVGPTDVVTATDVATVTVEAANPSITLSKSVGTDPTSCGITDEITLPAGGGEVIYCYEVTNTGNITLSRHDLDDSELGNLFTGLSYALAPGASAFITETATIAMTTVNTALWTAYNVGPTNVVTATDVATVTVETAGGLCPAGPEAGELTTGDPVFNRPVGSGGSCNLSGVGTAVYYDVYSYNLGGPPPHDLFASLVGGTTMDTVLVFYQAPDGSSNPFDPTQGCLNNVAYNDDFDGNLQSQISATGLGAGWIDVVVTTFDNGTTGAYAMGVASESCQGGEQEPPNIDVSPLSLSSTQAPDVTTNQTLDIANTGEADLAWEILEEPGMVLRSTAGGLAPRASLAGATGSRGGAPDAATPRAYLSMADFSEGFDDITLLPGLGWFFQNNSSPLGLTDWFQGNDGVFPAHAGAPTAYIGANFNNTSGVGTISNWMLTPEISLADGDTIAFWTRTAADSIWADRLQVRLSTAGASTNVGTLATDVGDFTTLLLDINPTLVGNGYPQDWTQYSATLSGIPVGATGRIAFRYFVENGGPNGSNSNYIGIDTVEYVSGQAQICDAPADVPWLSTVPISGTTMSGATTPVDVAFDSTGLSAGTYNANLCVFSNDPDEGPGNETSLVIVPVELIVEQVLVPSIVLTKTVGTVDGVCATTDDITVPEGTTVYYCYTVANTGDVTLNLHDLVDNPLGTIFSGLNYALTPGGSVNTVAAGLSLPAVINVTTVNTATWTAYNTGGPSVSASDSARVVVIPSAVSVTGLRASAAGGWSSVALLGALALGGFTWRRRRR